MITIIDHVGRTVIGKLVTEDENTLTINNPVIIHVTPDPNTGRIQVQSFPYIFMEFIDKESRNKNDWTFYKTSIIRSNIKLDQPIINQYNQVNAVPQPQPEAPVIKLFED